MRRFLVPAIGLAILLAACAPSQQANNNAPGGAPADEGPAQKGGTLQFAASRPPANLAYWDVQVTTKQPAAEFFTLLASGSSQVKSLPKHIADKGQKFEDTAIGTGPYKLQTFDPLSKSVLVRNESYYRDGPYPDKVNVIYGLD